MQTNVGSSSSISLSGTPPSTPSPSKTSASSAHPGVRKDSTFKRNSSAAKTARKLPASREEENNDVATVLKVPDPAHDATAFYESLLQPVDEHPAPTFVPSPFSPLPPSRLTIAALFVEEEDGTLHVDLPELVRLYRPLVHPDHVEWTINPITGLRTVEHEFINLAILPDFFLNNRNICRALDLCP